jgi:KTSC domain
MYHIISFILFQSVALSVLGQSCKDIPIHFNSYEAAIHFVKNAEFKFRDEANTSKSSWIRSASYYSCDGRTGYFILETDKREYIHASVPIEIWKDFKNAESLGGFYDHNIRKRFRFNL